MDSVNLIIRPASSLCNLACHYCYNALEIKTVSPTPMGKDVLRHLVKSFIGNGKFKHVKFLWHGGEPLLAGINFYHEAINLQKIAASETKLPVQYSNTIQTNGTLITENLARLLTENKFHFGISVDGPKNIHDSNRRTKKGADTHKTILKNINLLRSLGAKFGIVSVISKISMPFPEMILDFFLSEGLKNIHFLPYAEINYATNKQNERSITAAEFGEFIVRIFKQWQKFDDPKIKIRIIDNFIQRFLGGNMELCTFLNDCQAHISVESNGNMFVCGRHANNPNFLIGNIQKHSAQDIPESPQLRTIMSNTKQVSNECKNCEWLKICHGGCAYYRFLYDKNGTLQPEYFCEGYKVLFKEIGTWLRTQGVDYSLN